MQKCEKCSNQFGWNTIVTSIWLRLYSPIVCGTCGAKHYANFSSKIMVAFSLYIPVLVNNYVYSIFKNYSIFIYIIWIIFMICITPYFAKYHVNHND